MFARYQLASEKTIWRLRDEVVSGACDDHSEVERLMVKYARCITIKMVGVWDTVGALGIPRFRIPGISRSTLGWHHTGLRVPIEHGFHAIAIDEHRPPFEATLWSARKGINAAPRAVSSVEQRWFVGAHANVGGGYTNDLLGQPSLLWMLGKAKELGMEFRYEISIDGNIQTAKINDSYKDFVKGAYSKIFKRHYRLIGQDAWIDKLGNSHSTVNETIDATVFEYYRANPSYRPPNLVDWAERKQLDLSKAGTSVLGVDASSLLG